MARPSVPLLSQEAIVEAAMKLSVSLGDFTMAQLAGELGVRASSLYNHVASKSEVINLIRSVWLESLVDEASTEPRGLSRLLRLAEGFYDRVASSPGLVPLLFQEPLVEEASLRFYEEIAASANSAGIDHDDLSAVVALIDAYVLGSVLDGASPSISLDNDQALHYPHLAALVQHAERGRRRGRTDFLTGLRILGAGLDKMTTINQHKIEEDE